MRQCTASTQPDPWGFGAQYGYYTDSSTGLVLCTHRYYDPSTGRWLTRDPMGYDGGINLYGYVGNNPVGRADPLGFDGGTEQDGDGGKEDKGNEGLPETNPSGMPSGIEPPVGAPNNSDPENPGSTRGPVPVEVPYPTQGDIDPCSNLNIEQMYGPEPVGDDDNSVASWYNQL